MHISWWIFSGPHLRLANLRDWWLVGRRLVRSWTRRFLTHTFFNTHNLIQKTLQFCTMLQNRLLAKRYP